MHLCPHLVLETSERIQRSVALLRSVGTLKMVGYTLQSQTIAAGHNCSTQRHLYGLNSLHGTKINKEEADDSLQESKYEHRRRRSKNLTHSSHIEDRAPG